MCAVPGLLFFKAKACFRLGMGLFFQSFFQAQLKFPEHGLVFDYVFDDGGLSQGESAEAEEAEDDAKAEV